MQVALLGVSPMGKLNVDVSRNPCLLGAHRGAKQFIDGHQLSCSKWHEKWCSARRATWLQRVQLRFLEVGD